MKKKSDITVKYIKYGIFLLLFYLIQVSGILPRLFGGSALPMIPLVCVIAMFEGDAGGAVFGFAAGALIDVSSVHTAGFAALVLMLLGCVCGLFVVNLVRNTFLAALTLSAGTVTVYCLLRWLFFDLIAGRGSPFYLLWHYTVPTAVYTILLTIPIYIIMRRVMRKRR